MMAFARLIVMVTSLVALVAGASSAGATTLDSSSNIPEDPTAPVSESISELYWKADTICRAVAEMPCPADVVPEEEELPVVVEMGDTVGVPQPVDLSQYGESESAFKCAGWTCMYVNGEGRYVKSVHATGWSRYAGCAYGLLSFTNSSTGKVSYWPTNIWCYKAGTQLYSYYNLRRLFGADGTLCFQYVATSGSAPSGKPCVKVFKR